MTFAKRLRYYLIGIGLGTFVVFIFFGPRSFQCSYFPNSRALEEAKFYPISYTNEAKNFLKENNLDTIFVKNELLNKSEITNFGTEEVKAKPCRIYRADYKNDDKNLDLGFVYKICKDSTLIESISKK